MAKLIVSTDGLKDLLRAFELVTRIVATKTISKEEDDRILYCSKLYDSFVEDLKRNNPNFDPQKANDT